MGLRFEKFKRYLCTAKSSIQKVQTIKSESTILYDDYYLKKMVNGVAITPITIAESASKVYNYLASSSDKEIEVTMVWNRQVVVTYRFIKKRQKIDRYDMMYIIYHIRIMFLSIKLPRKTRKAMIALSNFYLDLIRKGESGLPWLS